MRPSKAQGNMVSPLERVHAAVSRILTQDVYGSVIPYTNRRTVRYDDQTVILTVKTGGRLITRSSTRFVRHGKHHPLHGLSIFGSDKPEEQFIDPETPAESIVRWEIFINLDEDPLNDDWHNDIEFKPAIDL